MILTQRRRLLTSLLITVLIAVMAASVAFSHWLDPGDKGDTSTDLVTPTIAAVSARVFAVLPEESQVDFTVEVRGITFDGVFPVQEGAITLEPVGDELRVIVRLNIDVDSVDTGNPGLNQVLRAAMATGDYPLAFYVATSREFVPVTEEKIWFMLDGELEVHNVAHEHSMAVNAQLVGRDMWAIATSDLDLANHGVEFPAFVGSTVIQLTARLQMVEAESIHQSGGPVGSS
jgi:polyisoprenoid-binding protein YceI